MRYALFRQNRLLPPYIRHVLPYRFLSCLSFLRQAAFIPVQKASTRKAVAAATAALCNIFILLWLPRFQRTKKRVDN